MGEVCGTPLFGVVLLAGGRGSRMNSDIPKQYMDIAGRPVLYYSLKVFQENPATTEIVIVTSPEDGNMVMDSIVNRYGFNKVRSVVDGGTERFNSVYNGLQELANADYVMIHDGARPCISGELLERLQAVVVKEMACIPAVPSKDTVKIADGHGYVKSTPCRDDVWNVQTPQVFQLTGIRKAFELYMESQDVPVTDDSMVWELHMDSPVKLVMGEYSNIKITTPEDLTTAEGILSSLN